MSGFLLLLVKVNLAMGAAALSTQPATSAKTYSNEPYVKTTCTDVPNGTVTGQVTSSQAIQIARFECGRVIIGSHSPAVGGTGGLNAGPCENHAHKISTSIWGRVCPDTPLLTMHVQFANSADASKMPLGKLVTLKGDFFVLTKDRVSYPFVQNARVLYADPFGR